MYEKRLLELNINILNIMLYYLSFLIQLLCFKYELTRFWLKNLLFLLLPILIRF